MAGGAQLMEEKKRKATLAARAVLRALPSAELESTSYSTVVASVILEMDVGTLSDARKRRLEWIADKKSIHPLAIDSIHFLGTPKPSYSANELLNFLKRREHANSLHVNAQKLGDKYPKEIAPRVLMGFQTWLVQADPDELWPFCIQASGRPLDLIAAMQLNETTEVVEWLTIREFGTRAADAASHDFHERQRQEIKSGLTEKVPTVAVNPSGRSGGPL